MSTIRRSMLTPLSHKNHNSNNSGHVSNNSAGHGSKMGGKIKRVKGQGEDPPPPPDHTIYLPIIQKSEPEKTNTSPPSNGNTTSDEPSWWDTAVSTVSGWFNQASDAVSETVEQIENSETVEQAEEANCTFNECRGPIETLQHTWDTWTAWIDQLGDVQWPSPDNLDPLINP